MPLTAAAISHKLREHAHPENVAILQRFFKTGPGQYGEGDCFIGVKVPSIRTVCRQCRGATLGEIRKLLRSPIHEERALALLMLVDAFKAGDEPTKRRIYSSISPIRPSSTTGISSTVPPRRSSAAGCRAAVTLR
jgi:DNA alkylation repair enzyme